MTNPELPPKTEAEVRDALLQGRMLPVRRNSANMRLLQAARIEIDNHEEYGPIAPDWAVALAGGTGVNGRHIMVALRRCARDPEIRTWVSALLGCVESKEERGKIAEQIARDSLQTIVCTCGRKFTSALVWRSHLEDGCPTDVAAKKAKEEENKENDTDVDPAGGASGDG